MICNPAKVEDHHAILPTVKKPGTLSPDEESVQASIKLEDKETGKLTVDL